ncbi:flagellar hook assembly protein FlgD [Motilimonas sp. 1_MG-2023]|uniref:flagellar hook assembly protein FlgD n=1 Tax=Motilimonas TaxID=1914248 RepID=UPI0026E3EF90|nr:flagellar hook assembly protein FlgD [Motilimonas sp. 1_MG-2023]MDO6524943.1 flagellar hook assembly protein FlgD [Motilimonas sp. 1_MG-2023]
MSSVNNVSTSNLYWEEKSITDKAAEANKKELDQEDFFSLLSQQLAYQDPFKPVDNAQMVAQMASFTTAEGIADMGKQFESMNSIMSSTQALQASGLVGRNVLVPTDEGHLAKNKALEGVAISGQPMNNLTVRIEDEKGNLVRVIKMDDQPAGNVRYSWDGKNEAGELMPPGNYKVKANARVNGESTDLPTANYAHVESVSLAGGTNGVVLNLQGIGSVMLSDVLEVSQTAGNLPVTPPTVPSEPDDNAGESVEQVAARLKEQLGA